MKRLILIAAAATLSLSACQLPSFSLGTPLAAPAPLAQTTIDDTALETAWRAFDTALDGINLLIDAKVIKIGSPKAIAIANGIDRVTKLLNAAERAAAAGSTTDYRIALTEAKAAISEVRSALKGN